MTLDARFTCFLDPLTYGVLLEDWRLTPNCRVLNAAWWYRETQGTATYQSLIPPFTRYESVPEAYCRRWYARDKALWPCWQWTYRGSVCVWKRWLVWCLLVLDWWHWVISTRCWCSVLVHVSSLLSPVLAELTSRFRYRPVPYPSLLDVGNRWNIWGHWNFYSFCRIFSFIFTNVCIDTRTISGWRTLIHFINVMWRLEWKHLHVWMSYSNGAIHCRFFHTFILILSVNGRKGELAVA